MAKPKIVIVGAGNVATHLAPALSFSGCGDVVQVYSRSQESASELASKIPGAEAVSDPCRIVTDADIYLISVSDDAIPAVVDALPRTDALYLHTSGSVGMEALSTLSDRYGVFYPLQTFSKGVSLDVAKVPLFIEGANDGVEAEIREFASKLFESIYHADSETRKKMHISAVFACNFTNYLWTLAADLLSRDGLPFDVLRPLLEETLRKALVNSPAASQTGPASRGDRRVTDGHLALLDGKEREIYSLLTDCIMARRGSDR
ncbi:MAG: DUF2520 domain-containing protein [Bacteroides sp.]|nr:DUF2520 domain-containing protein [Bacteroides sp.]